MTERETDVAIAKALGFSVNYDGIAAHYRMTPPVNMADDDYTWFITDSPELCWQENAPRYSTDPAAMLVLIEAMRERGWVIHAMTPYPRKDEEMWDAMFMREYAPEYFKATAPALPAAVAIAALKALEASR